jgi:hypothetical protein
MCELLDDVRSTVGKRLWCVACQASICRAAISADAREFGSVMGTIHKIVVQKFRLVVSYDDTTEDCGEGYKCFSNALDYLL